MIAFGLLVLLVLGAFVVAARGGLPGVARARKYKSGTGWCAWRWTDVESEYILRLHLVKTPWFAVCLHWIRKPDAEPWLHDHPVSFLSIILRGQYAELRQKPGDGSPRLLLHRWFNFVRADEHDRHRIVFTRRNTLTLCFMGPKTREWGFHVNSVDYGVGRLGWKDYYEKKRRDDLPLDKTTSFSFYKELDACVDAMSAAYETMYAGSRLFVDEEVRRISTIDGDFDDEAPTRPR